MTHSDKASSADNQQERLIITGWIIGFVDGEGCFSVGFIKQPNRLYKKGYRIGVQAWHEFVVTQGEKSLPSLKEIQNFFKVGKIYLNKRYDNHKEHLYRYVVRNRDDLRGVIIPFFEKYPLHSAKVEDFKKFVRTFRMIEKKEHLSIQGMKKLLKIASTMNRRKNRSEVIRILNDHTRGPDALSGKIWSGLNGDIENLAEMTKSN